MLPPVFKGTAAALITPFSGGEIDYAALARLTDAQINGGTDALVVCGTTGEAATLTDAERRELIAFEVKQARGRVPVIAGTGSNCTAYAADLTAYACKVGADAVLCVTPYYNKCTQDGLFRHYEAICAASSKPVIVYNVPSRTCVNIEPATYARLAELPMFGGIKEAGGSVAQAAKTLSLCPPGTHLYSGSDELFLPMLSIGAEGIISVASNAEPRAVKEIWTLFREGKNEKAAEAMKRLMPLIDFLFSKPNPIPLKWLLSKRGVCENELRLPLTPMEDGDGSR